MAQTIFATSCGPNTSGCAMMVSSNFCNFRRVFRVLYLGEYSHAERGEDRLGTPCCAPISLTHRKYRTGSNEFVSDPDSGLSFTLAPQHQELWRDFEQRATVPLPHLENSHVGLNAHVREAPQHVLELLRLELVQGQPHHRRVQRLRSRVSPAHSVNEHEETALVDVRRVVPERETVV
jgi:hypothetical protein